MSTLAHGEVQAAAESLLQAYTTRTPRDPIITEWPGADIGDAYAIQQATVARWIAGGDVVRGHKVGLASAAMQRQMGVQQPDFGHLTGSMFFAEESGVPETAFIQPRIEPEVAFVLGSDLRGPGVTVADALRAVDFVVPALEIVDSRIRDWRISIVDTVADNASSGGLVLGDRPTSLRGLDLRGLGCVLYDDGEIAATGAGGAVLGSPILAVAWLANTLGELGVTLEAGHVVLPGSMTRAIPFRPGATVHASMAGLGTVTARSVRQEAA